MTHDALQALLKEMTLEEKVGQLTQCNAGQFIAVNAEITGPEGEVLPAEDLNRVMGSVLTFENAEQARRLQDMHLAADRNRIPLLLMCEIRTNVIFLKDTLFNVFIDELKYKKVPSALWPMNETLSNFKEELV